MSILGAMGPLFDKLAIKIVEQPTLSRRLGQGVLGAGIGGTVGAVANDEEDDSGSILAGAALGGLIGGMGPNAVYKQMGPVTDWFAQQLPHQLEKGEPTKSPISPLLQKRAEFQDTLAPLKAIPGITPETTMTMDTSMGGGAGLADSLFSEPKAVLHTANKAGLGNAVREYMTLNLGRRAWVNLQDKLQEAAEHAQGWDAFGQEGAAKEARARYFDLQEKLENRKVTFGDASVARLQELEDQFKTTLGEDHFNKVKSAADSVYDSLRKTLDLLYEDGQITKTEYQSYIDEADKIPYSPGFRSMMEQDAEGVLRVNPRTVEAFKKAGMSVKSTDNIIQMLEGSAKPYADPLESALFHIQESSRNLGRNKAVRTFIENATAVADEAGKVPGSSFFIRPKDPKVPLKPSEGVITYYKDGAPQDFVVPVEYAQVMDMADAQDVAKSMAILSRMQRFAAGGITAKNIAFAASNIPKDIMGSFIYNPQLWRNPLEFGKQWGKAALDIIKEDFYHRPQSAARKEFREGGASHSTLSRSLSDMPAYQTVVGDHDQGYLSNVTRVLQELLNIGEESTKMATFHTLKKVAPEMTPLERAWRTRHFGGSPDFALWGSHAKEVGAFYMFFNPTIQGLNRFYEQGAKDPGWLLKTMGAMTMGVFALDRWNKGEWPGQDKDSYINPETGKSYIEELDPTDRLNNLVILTGGTEVTSQGHVRPRALRIPLDHVAIALLTPLQDAMKVANEEVTAPSAGQFVADVASPLLPITGNLDAKKPFTSLVTNAVSSANPLIREPIEQLMNASAFNDVPIVGERMSKMEPGHQFNETTSPTIVKLANLPGVNQIPWVNSPQRLEHMFRTFLPGAYELPLSALDYRTPKVAQGEQEAASKLPIAGPIIRRWFPTGQDAIRDQDSEQFYGALDRANEAVATYNGIFDPEEKAAYGDAHEAEIAGNKILTRYARALGSLGKQRQMILADETLSPEERRAQIQELYAYQRELLKDASQTILELQVN